MTRKKSFVLGRLDSRGRTKISYTCTARQGQEPTKEGLLSYLLHEFTFAAVSTVSRGHPCRVPLCVTFCCNVQGWAAFSILNVDVRHPKQGNLHSKYSVTKEYWRQKYGGHLLCKAILPAVSTRKGNIVVRPDPRRLQRDVVYLGWPIALSYMSLNTGGGGELRGLSPWVVLY